MRCAHTGSNTKHDLDDDIVFPFTCSTIPAGSADFKLSPLLPSAVQKLISSDARPSSPFTLARGRVGVLAVREGRGEEGSGSEDFFMGASRPLNALWSQSSSAGLSFEDCELLEAVNTGSAQDNSNKNVLWRTSSTEALTYEMCELLAAVEKEGRSEACD